MTNIIIEWAITVIFCSFAGIIGSAAIAIIIWFCKGCPN